jgi:hypothetical protein
MSYGWIKVHRQIQSHWLYTDKREFSYFEAWIDILLTVNHADAKTMIQGTLYEVKRGQSINSLDTWAKRWKWSKSKVRRFLKTLEIDSMIETKSETITTRLTVCNYDSYQDERNAGETQTKRKRNAGETQMTPNKNDKECLTNENNDFNIHCERFVKYVGEQTGRKFKTLNDKNKRKLQSTIKQYSWEQIRDAVYYATQNKFHKDNNYQYLTPEFFTRPETIDKYAFPSEKQKEYTGENAHLVNHVDKYLNAVKS